MRSTANSRQTPRRVSAGLFVLISVLALAVLAITASGVGADSERAQVDPNAIVPGGPVSLVFVSPPASAAVGDTITLTVRIVAGATPVRGGRIFLNYNPSLLDWDEVNGFYGTGNFPLTITTGTSEAQGHLNINFFKEGTNTQTGNIQAFRVDFNVLACGTVNIPFVFDAPDRDTEIYQGTSGEVNALGAVTNLSFPVNEGCVEATPTSTSAPPTATATDVPPTATNTSAPPTATATDVPPTATNTSAPPTATSTGAPPTATSTSVPPTATDVPPTATSTSVPPTATDVPPTATSTSVPPTATDVPPTATATDVPPTATPTDVPPTATATDVPPTPTEGPSPTASPTSDGSVPAEPSSTPVPEAYVACDNLGERTGGEMTSAGGGGIAVVGAFGPVRISTTTRAKISTQIVGNAYCRVIALHGDFVTSAEEIGDAGVLGLGVVNAVDIFGLLPDGTPANNFTRVMQVCMRASSGDMLMFAAASGVPRSYVPLDTYISGDYICGFIDRAGTVVQIG